MADKKGGRPPLPPLVLAVQNADVLRALDNATLSTPDLADATGQDRSNLRKTCLRLVEAGLLHAYETTWGLTSKGLTLLPRLDVLEGKAPVAGPDSDSDLTTLTHAEIEPDPDNPRQVFEREALQALKYDILERWKRGQPPVLQNLVVHKGHGGDRWMLAAGERRWRAIGELIEDDQFPADFPIPVRKLPFADAIEAQDRLWLVVSENLQRADLNRIEEGELYRRLVEGGSDTAAIADRVRRSRRHIQQHIQLLELSPEDQARVKSGELGFKAALELLQDHRTPPAAPPLAAPSDAGASEARTEGVGADNAAASAPTGEGAAAFKPDAAPSMGALTSNAELAVALGAAGAEGTLSNKTLMALLELVDACQTRPSPERGYTRDWSDEAGDHTAKQDLINCGCGGLWDGGKTGYDQFHAGPRPRALLEKHGLIPTAGNRDWLLVTARGILIGQAAADRHPSATPYWTKWLNPPAKAKAAPKPDTLKVSGSAPALAGGAGFSASTPASAARPDPAALAAALDTAQVLHLAEIGWAVRIAGRFLPWPSGRLARAISAARANEDATTRRLVNGTGLPDLLVFWMAPGHGPLLALNEDGRQALKHVAPALGNLDAPERDAFAELDALRAAAGISEADRKALAQREQSSVSWLNDVLAGAATPLPRGEARQAPAGGGRGEGETPAPEPIFALYAGDVVRIAGGAHYRLIGALSRAAGETEACSFLAQQIRKSRRGKGEGTDYGEPRQLTLSAIEELLERGTTDPEHQPDEEAA